MDYVTSYAGKDARILVAKTQKNQLVDLQTGEVDGDTLIYVPTKKVDLDAKVLVNKP